MIDSQYCPASLKAANVQNAFHMVLKVPGGCHCGAPPEERVGFDPPKPLEIAFDPNFDPLASSFDAHSEPEDRCKRCNIASMTRVQWNPLRRLQRTLKYSGKPILSSRFRRCVCTSRLLYEALPPFMRTACTIPSPSNLQIASHSLPQPHQAGCYRDACLKLILLSLLLI